MSRFLNFQKLVSAVVITAALISFGLWKLNRHLDDKSPLPAPARAQVAAFSSRPGPAPPPEAPQSSPGPVAKPAKTAASGAAAEMLNLAVSAGPREREEVIRRLATLGEGAISDLGAAMRAAPSAGAKLIIAQALALIGTSEAVDQMIANLQAVTDPAEQASLVHAFDGLANPAGLETLTSSLASVDDPALSRQLIGVIGHLASDDTVQFLAEMYREQPNIPSQPDNVVAALAGINNPNAVTALAQLASEAAELPLQYAAVRALGAIGTPEALEGILSATFRGGNTNPAFRQAVLSTLQSVTNPQAIAWLEQQSRSPNLPADVAASVSKALAGLRK